MTTYNTYQEAKIANPESDIYSDGSMFFASSVKTFMYDSVKCNPADHCMTVERFLAGGHKFVEGDIYLNSNGQTLGVVNIPVYNNEPSTIDCDLYILRAAALENIPTETPEEKEALDGIESAGEVEWKNGDLLEFNGEPCVFIGDYNGMPVVRYTENADQSLAGCLDEIYAVDKLKKPETPQQRKDRERLEVIDEMCWDVHSLKFSQASALYEAGYRKEKTHGTN